jgi:hypothetical protein
MMSAHLLFAAESSQEGMLPGRLQSATDRILPKVTPSPCCRVSVDTATEEV